MKVERRLILGMATGYLPDAVFPFLSSISKAAFDCKIVLFVFRRQLVPFRRMAAEQFPGLEIELVRIRGIGAYPRILRAALRLLVNTFIRLIPILASRFKQSYTIVFGLPHHSRFFHCRDYVARHGGYSRVMLTDVRDVIFQTDPFLGIAEGLYVGMENPETSIVTDRHNRIWLLKAYGETLLKQIGERQISCAGVTIGDPKSVEIYLQKMCFELLQAPILSLGSVNLDQAMHNKLLYCNELPQVHLCQPLSSVIATVGILKEQDFTIDPKGALLNLDGRPAPIVHQYDRHPMLAHLADAPR